MTMIRCEGCSINLGRPESFFRRNLSRLWRGSALKDCAKGEKKVLDSRGEPSASMPPRRTGPPNRFRTPTPSALRPAYRPPALNKTAF